MSDKLREAFRDLAEQAPDLADLAAAGPQTWRVARQARRRLVGAVACIVAVMLVGGLAIAVGLSRSSAQPVAPPYDVKDLAIPNQVWTPGPWTPGTANAGPIGPLALVGSAPRRTSWFHLDSDALFGVSAVTGSYRFLDLPGADTDGNDVELSPDGTKIAYWLLGTIASAKSQPNDVGVAIYDTITGQVARKLIPSTGGIHPQWLTWSSDSRSVAFQYTLWGKGGSRLGGGSSFSGATEGWNVATSLLTPLPIDVGAGEAGPAGGGVGVFTESGLEIIDPADASVGHLTGNAQSLAKLGHTSAAILNPAGDTAAAQVDPEHGFGPRVYVVGVRGSSDSLPARQVKGTDPFVLAFYGWTDNDHILIAGWPTSRVGEMPPQIYSLDINTGRESAAIKVHNMKHQSLSPQFALDLLTRDFASRPQPPTYRDPRVLPSVIVSVAALVVLALVTTAVVRRPRRTRGPVRPRPDQ